MIRLAVFDLDGTLCNTIGDIAASMNRALESLDLPTHSVQAIEGMVGNGMRRLCSRALPEDRQALLEALEERYYADYSEHLLDSTQPYEGIETLLSALQEKGLQLALISNKPEKNSQDMAAGLFPKKPFIHVQGQRADVPKKPDPNALLSLMEALGIPSEETLYIGDSDVDYLFAANAGTRFCGVSWGFRGRAFLERTTKGYIIDRPMELVELIESLG